MIQVDLAYWYLKSYSNCETIDEVTATSDKSLTHLIDSNGTYKWLVVMGYHAMMVHGSIIIHWLCKYVYI